MNEDNVLDRLRAEKEAQKKQMEKKRKHGDKSYLRNIRLQQMAEKLPARLPAQENSAVARRTIMCIRSNLGEKSSSTAIVMDAAGCSRRAHWSMPLAAIRSCCSATGTEQLPSSFLTTWPRWISPQSWS